MAKKTTLDLNGPVGRSYNTDLDDVALTKDALKELGYYKDPEHGPTPYADEKLFEGLEKFQKDHGLKVDGVIKPDGETADKLFDIAGRSPTYRCKNPICRGFHGGIDLKLCPDCKKKKEDEEKK